jgi:hypothetical protein
VRAVLEQLAGELAAGQFSGRETLLQRQADKVRRAFEKGRSVLVTTLRLIA